jgi:hypothetical protein
LRISAQGNCKIEFNWLSSKLLINSSEKGAPMQLLSAVFCNIDLKDSIIVFVFRHVFCTDFKDMGQHLDTDLLINAFDISSLVF